MDEVDSETVRAMVAKTNRANLISDIVGHPLGSPTRAELEHMNPSVASSDLREQIDTLENHEIIASVHGHSADRRDEDHVFYYLTEQARVVFDENNFFDEDAHQAVYQEVNKPPEIKALEETPRPAISASTIRPK